MISQLRKKMFHNSYGLKFVMWTLLFLGFLFPALMSLLPDTARRIDRYQRTAVITIDDQGIDAQAVHFAVQKQQERLAQLRHQLGEYSAMYLPQLGLDDPKGLAVKQLVTNALLVKEARKLGLKVSSDYLAQNFANPYFVIEYAGDIIPYSVFDQTGRINMGMLEQFLRSQGMSLADLEYKMEGALLQKTLVDMLGMVAYVSPKAVHQKFVQDHVAKKFSLIKVPYDQFTQQVTVTDQEVKDYYDKVASNDSRYVMPERRSAQLWQFDPAKYGIEITDEKIQKFYDRNKRTDFGDQMPAVQVRKIEVALTDDNRAQTQARIEGLRAELVAAPEKFAEYARQYSQDKDSAKQGGLLPFMEKGKTDVAIESAMFRLTADGEISPVITLEDKVVILQRVARRKQTFKSLESVKSKIKEALFTQSFDEKFLEQSIKAIEKAETNPAAIETFATQKGAVQSVLNNVLKNNMPPVSNVFATRKGEYAAFIDKGRGFIVLVTDIQKEHVMPFEAVKERIKQDLVAQKAEKLMLEALAAARDAAQTETFSKIALDHKGSFHVTDLIDPEMGDVKKQLQGLTLAQLAALDTEGAMITVAGKDAGYLVRLDQTGSIDQEQFTQEKEKIYNSALQQEKSRLIKGFIASLHRNATITIDQLALKEY